MRSILARLRCAPPATSSMVVAPLATVLSLWFHAMFHGALLAPEWTFDVLIPLELVLLATFALAFGIWISLHLLGLVGSGTAAGFRLVLLGFATRTASDLLGWYAMTDMDATGLVYRAPGPVGGALWLVRNGSLVCYGFGLSLVVLSTAVELRRRTRTPAWTRPAD